MGTFLRSDFLPALSHIVEAAPARPGFSEQGRTFSVYLALVEAACRVVTWRSLAREGGRISDTGPHGSWISATQPRTSRYKGLLAGITRLEGRNDDFALIPALNRAYLPRAACECPPLYRRGAGGHVRSENW